MLKSFSKKLAYNVKMFVETKKFREEFNYKIRALADTDTRKKAAIWESAIGNQ